MQTSPRGAIAHNVLLPRNFQIQRSNVSDVACCDVSNVTRCEGFQVIHCTLPEEKSKVFTLTALTTLKYFCINYGDQRGFSI